MVERNQMEMRRAQMKGLMIKRPDKSREEEINAFFRLVLEDTFQANGLDDMTQLLEEEIEEKGKLLAKDFISRGQGVCFLIAEMDGEIVGTIEYGTSNPLIQQCTDHALDEVMEVGTVFVHPAYQGKGIGQAMSLAILQRMQAAGQEDFCFDSGYPLAQGVWSHIYGAPEYLKKDFWGKDADHMVWHKKVSVWISHFGGHNSDRTNE
jgi:GNAT superfamily N-acetyltransferase